MVLRAAKRKRAPRTDHDVIEAIQAFALDGITSPVDIRRRLDTQEKYEGRVPSTDTTIRNYVREVAPKDRSSPWSLADEMGSPIALRVLADVIERTEGRVRSLSVAEVERITRLAELVPDL